MRRLAPILCILLGGCGAFDFLSGSLLTTLHRNRDRWTGLAIRDYDFEFHKSCYCGQETTEPVRIAVRGGDISRVVSTLTGQEVAPSQYVIWPTIDSLFVWTERSFGHGYKLTITYDAAHRFPAQVVGDIPGAIDDEFTNSATNFVRK